ncbi:MAG: hypothetical protein Q7S22_07465 [Candidatus Micrarchaeota archaeon]|nr:hypothetical protein [Candidatus Micrarchaeota archaeon]
MSIITIPVKSGRRTNPKLFHEDGHARSGLIKIHVLLDDILKPKGIRPDVFVVGSQAKGTFRTDEDISRIILLGNKSCSSVTSDDLKFAAGLLGITEARTELAFRFFLTVNGSSGLSRDFYYFVTRFLGKFIRTKPSDLDIAVIVRQPEQVSTSFVAIAGSKELEQAILELGIHTEFFISNGLSPGSAFDIKREQWFQQVEVEGITFRPLMFFFKPMLATTARMEH